MIESQLLLAKQKEAADKDIYLGLQVRIDEAAGKIEMVKKENQCLLQQLEEERNHSASLEEARKRYFHALDIYSFIFKAGNEDMENKSKLP